MALGPDFTQIQRDLSFYEGYGKVNWTINDSFAVGANWCGATGIAKLSADLTAMSNLK